jgi:hypothetical protein
VFLYYLYSTSKTSVGTHYFKVTLKSSLYPISSSVTITVIINESAPVAINDGPPIFTSNFSDWYEVQVGLNLSIKFPPILEPDGQSYKISMGG